MPPELAQIADQVETARGHTFTTPPKAEGITDQEMDRRLEESFRAYYPKDLYDRRTFAWRTIGVIPPDADLHEAYRTFLTGEVVGFYDPETGELVYLGSGDLGFTERLTLAHELTHALDDQTFDLTRLDALVNGCQDERAAAALGLIEGSAQYFSAASVTENPDVGLSDLIDAIAEAAAGRLGARGRAAVPVRDQHLALHRWDVLRGHARGDGRHRGRGSRVRAIPRLDGTGDPPRSVPERSTDRRGCARSDGRARRTAGATWTR